MDKSEKTDIAVIKNDVDWIKKTISEKFRELGTRLDGIPMAIESINKRIDSNDKRLSTLEQGFLEHLKSAEKLMAEHEINTEFRKQTTFMVKHYWKVVGLLGIPGVLAVIDFIKNNL